MVGKRTWAVAAVRRERRPRGRSLYNWEIERGVVEAGEKRDRIGVDGLNMGGDRGYVQGEGENESRIHKTGEEKVGKRDRLLVTICDVS